LSVGLSGPFSLALAGDLIPSHPIAPSGKRIPGFAPVLDILAGADLCCGNLETSIFDMASFGGHPYCGDNDVTVLAPASCARDLAALGFRMLARANNHALDWGTDGMRVTSRLLDAAGIAHSGAGENLGLARRASYVELSQGRVAMVSVAMSFRPTTEALEPKDATPGRPGISVIRLGQTDIVTADDMTLLRQFGASPDKDDGVARLFGRRFATGTARGYRHQPDPADLAGFLREVRHAKQNADFVVVMIHSHEFARDGYPEPPSAVLRTIAHAAIEAGADTIAVTGLHHVGPVDIHAGRPIFYGLGNFIWGDIQEFLSADSWQQNSNLLASAFDAPERATAADLSAVANAGWFAHPEVFEGVLPVVRFDGVFVEAVLHPIDLGHGEPLTRSGIPRLAEREQAERILARIRAVSAEFGCARELEIAGGVGVLRGGR